MKRLACFLLEGLVEQGPHRVWVTLGTYESFDAARTCQPTEAHGARLVETRVIALYRDSGIAGAAPRAHFVAAASNQGDTAGTTVA